MKRIEAVDVRRALLARVEIALIDVRDEATFATGHPLFAVQIPSDRLALELPIRVPRQDTLCVLYASSDDEAAVAGREMALLGYSDVRLMAGGLPGWQAAGYELFSDVNSYCKAFGELVEVRRHTPSLPPEQVRQLIEENADIVVVDVRRPDEYRTMNIPGSTNIPGAELVLRLPTLLASEKTTVIVNCAGRTRSIIGTQSLVNAGIANPVYALRNGTIGWSLAGQALEHGSMRQVPEVAGSYCENARAEAAAVAYRAGVRIIDMTVCSFLMQQTDRTTYLIDVRTADEYLERHVPRFQHVPGGQLVQETDHHASVRGARVILADDLGCRALMSAAWLAQMGWEVYVLDAPTSEFTASGRDPAAPPPRGANGRYRRPYEGTDNPAQAMQAYLDWEAGLVDQLRHDATHGFLVI
jgi:rhodanese-related sulfurtransferase